MNISALSAARELLGRGMGRKPEESRLVRALQLLASLFSVGISGDWGLVEACVRESREQSVSCS